MGLVQISVTDCDFYQPSLVVYVLFYFAVSRPQ